jgi:hypothetical protein
MASGLHLDYRTLFRHCRGSRILRFISQPRRTRTEIIDPLRSLGLRQAVIELLARFVTECPEIGALRFGHRLIAGLPLIRVALKPRLSGGIF